MLRSRIYRKCDFRIAAGIISLIILLLASSAGAVPVEEWNKTFGGTGNDAAKSVQQTSDGGYIIAGYKFSSGNGYDSWLIKTDENGNEQWSKTFGGTGEDRAEYVQQTSDGGYILAGYASSSGTGMDAMLIKTDANGNQQWNRTFGGRGSDEARSVQQTLDGGYILAAKIFEDDDAMLIKIDANGNHQWSMRFGREYTGKVLQPPGTFVANASDESYFVQQTKDGGYILAAKTQSTYGDALSLTEDVWIIKTDADGKEQWSKIFDGANIGQIYSVHQTSDGGYILAGYTELRTGNNDAWLIKTDENGNQQWSKTLGGIKIDVTNSVQQTKDGGYVLVGYAESYGAGKYDAWLIKTDANGDEQWSKTFGGASEERAYAIQQTTDSGYVLAGSVSSYGAGLTDAWLIKVRGEPTETTIVPTASMTEKAEPAQTPTAIPTEKAIITEVPEAAPTEKATGFEIILAIAIFSAVYIFRRNRR